MTKKYGFDTLAIHRGRNRILLRVPGLSHVYLMPSRRSIICMVSQRPIPPQV
jgi:hypothetical protein